MTTPANPSVVAEAVRDVLLANDYRQSSQPGAFDTDLQGRLHRQFYLVGPELEQSDPTSGQIIQRWILGAFLAFQPSKGAGDVDRGQLDAADLVSELDELLQADSTIIDGASVVQSSSPEYDEDLKVWVVLFQVAFHVGRTV